MSDTHRANRTNRTVIAHLEDTPCLDCDYGTLEAAIYKGDVALVCDECGTPRARFWNLESETVTRSGGTAVTQSTSDDT